MQQSCWVGVGDTLRVNFQTTGNTGLSWCAGMTFSLWWRQVHDELGAIFAPPQAEQSQLLRAPCGGDPPPLQSSSARPESSASPVCVQRQEEVLD